LSREFRYRRRRKIKAELTAKISKGKRARKEPSTMFENKKKKKKKKKTNKKNKKKKKN